MATIYQRRSAKYGARYTVRAAVRGYAPRVRTFNTKKEAADWGEAQEREMLALKKEQGTGHDFHNYTIGGLVRDFLAEPRTKAQRSLGDTSRRAAWFVDKYGAVKIMDVNSRLLRKARAELAEDRGPATVNRHLSVLRSAWNFGIKNELIPGAKQWPKGLMLPEPSGRIRFLNHSEIAALLKASEADPVMRAAIMVSIGCGVRQGELLRLKWADVDLVKGALTVHLSKSGKRRHVHIPANAVEALRKLRKLKMVSPVDVFLNTDGKPLKKSLLETRWRKMRTAAKLADFRWHDLRHSTASLLAQNGATLLEIGSVLGHSTPSMTLRYAHLVPAAPVKGADKINELLK
jgi:integrase